MWRSVAQFGNVMGDLCARNVKMHPKHQSKKRVSANIKMQREIGMCFACVRVRARVCEDVYVYVYVCVLMCVCIIVY